MTYIIAEIGQNHNGDMATAKALIEAASEAGANAVKSQKRDVWERPDPDWNRPYESENSFGATYLEHRRALELSLEQHEELAMFANVRGLQYGLSCWDRVSAEDVIEAGFCDFLKVASASLTNYDVLDPYSTSPLPILLSTGMSTGDEIEEAVGYLSHTDLTVMLCTSSYPCEMEDVNLSRIETLRSMFPHYRIGVSGHWNGIAIDIAAVAKGAEVLERHFTLKRTMKGSDHVASLEPGGLTKLVRDVRAVEVAMGRPNLRVLPCEEPARRKLRGAA